MGSDCWECLGRHSRAHADRHQKEIDFRSRNVGHSRPGSHYCLRCYDRRQGYLSRHPDYLLDQRRRRLHRQGCHHDLRHLRHPRSCPHDRRRRHSPAPEQ